MTYVEPILYLFLYLVVCGVGVATMRGLRDGHDWNAEAAFIIGTAVVMTAWILAPR